MPHISVSIRDPDDVIKTSVQKFGMLTLVGMCLSFMTRAIELQRPVCQQNGTACPYK